MTKFFRYLLSLAILTFALFFSAAAPALAAPGQRVYTIYTYKNIGICHLGLGQSEKAEENYIKALVIMNTLKEQHQR